MFTYVVICKILRFLQIYPKHEKFILKKHERLGFLCPYSFLKETTFRVTDFESARSVFLWAQKHTIEVSCHGIGVT